MSSLSGKQGKELLVEVLRQLQSIDPKIVPFDSQEIEELEYGVAQAVRDFFGSGSPEYSEYEDFRISAGPVSRADSRTEKQSKYEMGLPKAASRLEELLELMDRSEAVSEPVPELSVEEIMEVEPIPMDAEESKPEPGQPPKPKAPAPPEAKGAPKAATRPTEKPNTAPAAREEKPPPKAPEPREAPKQPPAAGIKQPGKVLILSGAGEEITSSVHKLMTRLGIRAELPGKDPAALAMESLASVDHVAFTLMILSGGQKGGLAGLTSAIGMGRSNHELSYKLGFFVGRLGPGATAVLYDGERPADLPENLYGVRYIQYQAEGGWQIGLLKLLKANGFFIDANLLFE